MRLLVLALCAALLGCGAAASSSPEPADRPIATAPAEAPAFRCPPLSPLQALRVQVEKASAAASGPPRDLIGIDASSYFQLCASQPNTVACAGRAGRELSLGEVEHVDHKLRARFEYRGDFIQYGWSDPWVANVTCGDCEDYALTLADELAAAGASGGSMKLMLWSPWKGAGHATLLIHTSDAGWIEAGVNPGETPRAYDPNLGVRFSIINLDGTQSAVAVHQDVDLPQKKDQP